MESETPQESSIQHMQCLLFILHKGRPEEAKYPAGPSNHTQVKGFAIIPQVIKGNTQIVQLFQNFQIIENDQAYLEEKVYPLLDDGVNDNRVEIVELLIDEDAVISSRYPYVYVESYNNDVVDPLLGNNLFIQVEAKFHKKNIRTSLVAENLSFIEHLLSLRADITHRHAKGGTFLHLAAERGDKPLVELLLSNGAKVTISRVDGSTALHLAAQKGHMPVVNALVEAGADLDAKMKDGSMPLHLAVENGHTPVVSFLVTSGASVNATALSSSRLGNATPLHIAVEKKNCEMVKFLLGKGSDVNAEAFFGITVLQLAIEQGSCAIVEEVLSYSPDINNANNKRAFRLAVCRNDEEYDEIVNMLLGKGFTIEPTDVGDSELLTGAIRKNSLSIVQKLLELGLQVNDMLGDGFSVTPLHTAAKYSNEAMVQLLLDAGASPTAICGPGRTPVEVAFECVNLKAVKVFVANNVHNQDDLELFWEATDKGWLEVIQSLLDHRPTITVEKIKGRRFIFTAASRGHSNLVAFALKHGVPIDVRDSGDRTPLHKASSCGFPLVVEFLLRNGADVDVRCYRGHTPLYDAVRSDQTEVIEVLMKFGARIDIRDAGGNTVLYVAAIWGELQCRRTLLEYNFTNPAFLSFAYQPDWTLDLGFQQQLMSAFDSWGENQPRDDCWEDCLEIFAQHSTKKY